MCGIAGIIHLDSIKATRTELETMSQVISHRGPDDEGYFLFENMGFAHRRLSIQDLSSNAHQPMASKDGNFVLIYNGEIYNHWNIRKKLIEKGYEFTSSSDTETLLYGFIEYGDNVLQMLNGIFAFAILDKNKKEVFIARDHFGIKPLYFSLFNNTFVFSSELKSFINLPGFNKDIDYKALMSYTTLLWCPGYQTAFKNTNKLQAGFSLCVNLNSQKDSDTISLTDHSNKYYYIPFNGEYKEPDEKALVFELDYLLNRAVERQLLSDVPVGFFLSGGLDSSLIVAMAQKITGQRDINCFTINSGNIKDEGFADDNKYARLLANQLGLNLNVMEARTDILKDFDKLIWHLDEPQADPAPLHVYQISRLARENNIKVLLGGTGGDDIFSGYRRHIAIRYEKYIEWIPLSIRKGLTEFSGKLDARNPFQRRVKKLFHQLDQDKLIRLSGYFNWIPSETNLSLYNNDLKSELKEYDPGNFLIGLLNNIPLELNDLNRVLYWEMKTFLVDHNLNYTDKMSMAEGVEVRVPYLDRDLVEFSTRIPPSLKLKGMTTKYILRKVAEKYLPKEIIYRKKSGFGAPVRQWITKDLDGMIEERLSVQQLNHRGIFNPSVVWELIKNNKQGKIDASYTVWSLMAIESWMKQFVD